MALKRRLLRALVSQFGQPHGPLGHVAGWVMGRRPSNVDRSRWAVDLLDLNEGDRVLEVGCGPGVAVAAAAAKGSAVVGVDLSPVMVGQARRRNRGAVRRGQVTLVNASVDSLPEFEDSFDKALAVNTAGHWDDPVAGLKEISTRLRPGGVVVVVSQPRCPGATAAHSEAAGAELVRQLSDAGYDDIRTETLDLDPPAVAAIGTVS